MRNEQSRRQFLRSSAGIGLGCSGLPAFAKEDMRPAPATEVDAAVERALNIIRASGIDDVFPRPLEVDLLASNASLRRSVSSSVARSLQFGIALRHMPLSAVKIYWPKNDPQAYRSCSLIDAYDAVSYLALAILIARVTEPCRIAASDNRVFSHRLSDSDVTLFDSDYCAQAFYSGTVDKLRDDRKTWLVRTDIEGFYPNISHRRLHAILTSVHVNDAHIVALMNLLKSWEDGSGRGIPIGQDASRILGEVALMDADRELVAAGVDFIRFVDDYRLFAPDAAIAAAWLDLLSHILAREQLSLKTEKTAVEAVYRTEYADRWILRNLGPLSAKSEFAKDAVSPPCPPSGCRNPQRPKFRVDIDAYRRVVVADLFLLIEQTERPDLRDLRMLIEASFWRSEFEYLERTVMLLDRSPNILPYLANFLIQEHLNIPAPTRQRIANLLGSKLNDGRAMMDYEIICIARILSAKPYRNAQAVAEFIGSNTFRNRVLPIAQFVLPAFKGGIGDAPTAFLAEQFDAADVREQRAIAQLLLPTMNQDCRLAFLAQKHTPETIDPFLQAIFASAEPANCPGIVGPFSRSSAAVPRRPP